MNSIDQDMEWGHFLDLFRRQLMVSEGLAQNTVNSYCSDLSHFIDFVRTKALSPAEVDIYVLTDYLESCRGGEYSPRTISRRLATLNRFFAFLKKNQKIDANPVEKLERPQDKRQFPNYLDEEEVKQLLTAPRSDEDDVELRDRALLETLYGAGLRASEAAELCNENVDCERGEIRVTGKGDKQRLVPLGRQALNWLQEYFDKVRKQWDPAGKSNRVFITPEAKALTRQQIWQVVKKYAARVGLTDVSPHTLRDSFATHMLTRGADLRSLQKMLGHSDLRTTADIYVHLREEVREAHEVFHPRGGEKT